MVAVPDVGGKKPGIVANSPPVAPLTISPLPQLIFDVQILYLFIRFTPIVYQEISQFKCQTIIDSVCIENVSINTMTFVFL